MFLRVLLRYLMISCSLFLIQININYFSTFSGELFIRKLFVKYHLCLKIRILAIQHSKKKLIVHFSLLSDALKCWPFLLNLILKVCVLFLVFILQNEIKIKHKIKIKSKS